MAASMENVLGSIIQQLSSADAGNYDGLRQILSLAQTTNIFSIQSLNGIQEVLSHTHKCLSSSKHRIEGLLLLGQIVQQCNTDVFQQSASTWVNLLVQILQSHCSATVYKSTCLILSKVFYFAKNFTDISRDVVVSALPQIIPTLLSSPSELRPAAISCINSTIKAYSGPVGPFKNKIEALILSELEDGNVKQEIIQCFSLLPQCGPAGSLGSKHAEAWIGQCVQTITSLEQTLDRLYDGLETDSSNAKEGRLPLKLRAIDQDDPNRVAALTSRWQCLSSCLIGLLSEGPEATVKIPIEDVLQLVCRSLAINCKMLLNKPTTERTLLAAYLTTIHLSGLDVLEKLISVCGKSLVPHFGVIIRLMSQELTWTNTEKTGHITQFGSLREKVYSALSVWFKITTGSSGVYIEEKNLVKQILHDCMPMSNSLKLSGQTVQPQEPTGKKKKHKGYQEISHGISSQRKVHLYSNQGLVKAGLDALYWLILTAGAEMEKQSLQEVQSFCVGTLMSLQQTYSQRFPVPYGSSECRRALYRVLHACTVTSHPEVPPPTQCATGIFRSGLQDHFLEVSSFCTEAIRSCELLIHPRAPCLNGPIRLQNTLKIGESAEETKKNNYTDFNADQQFGNMQNGDKLSTRKQITSDLRNDVEMLNEEYVNTSNNQESSLSTKTFQNRKRTAEESDVEIERVANTKLVKIDSKPDKPKAGTSSDVSDNIADNNGDDVDDSDEQDDADNVIDEQNKGIANNTNSNEDLDRVKKNENNKMSDDSMEDDMYTATKIGTLTEPSQSKNKDIEVSEEKATGGVLVGASMKEKEESQACDMSNADNKNDTKEVEAMMMTFIDAEPDSD